MNSIFEKELEIPDATFEASMRNIINLDNIETTYMCDQ